MANFLEDRSFLLKVNQHKIRRYRCAILVLDFETENPIARLEGKVVSGTMNVAANSSVRKTCQLQIIFDDDTKMISDINNLIAIDKKISLSIGFDNPFYHTAEYQQYGETLWFKQGMFVITKASSAISNGARSVSIELMDKMAFLNGTCGGTLPASTSFHDRIIYDKDGNYITEYPTIKQIITECVHHFGGEHFSRISIEDVPDVGRVVVKYVGEMPINFQSGKDAKNSGRSFVIGPPPMEGFEDVKFKGDLVGYMETPLTYPGELIMKAGQTVTAVLDEIVKTLGNYEYFYDEDGIFHFRQIANYVATGKTPLNYNPISTIEVMDSQGNVSTQTVSLDTTLQNTYFPRFTDDAYLNEFADGQLLVSANYNPNYANIKNDFICWGTRNETSGAKTAVRYHLAIDVRPKDIPRPEPGSEEEKIIQGKYSLCHKSISEMRDINTGLVIRYAETGSLIPDPANEEWGEEVAPALEDVFPELDSSYHFNWREELYRQALLAYGSSTDGTYYDEELLAEWRQIYDPKSTFDRDGKKAFKARWEDHFGENNASSPWAGYNPDVIIAPENLRYWLDIIDTTSPVAGFGVNRIGRRTKVTENAKINDVFDPEIPDIVFVPNDGNPQSMQDNTMYYISIGQAFAFVNANQKQYFSEVNSFGTCYEEVRAMLYNHLIYNATVSLVSIPIFYLDVNKVVRLNLPENGIVGDYVINSLSWQLGQNNTMNLSLNEAIVMV